MQNDEALTLASLPKPDEAAQFIEALRTGRRLAYCAQIAGLTTREIASWRDQSAAFDDLCEEAFAFGVASIEDIGFRHISNAEAGWQGAWKTLLQQRDPSYADRAKVENSDTVKVIQAVPEAEVADDADSVEVPT